MPEQRATQQTHDVPGWEGFPVPPSWRPFRPHMSVAFDLSDGGCVFRELYDEYGKQELTQVLEKLATERRSRVLYHALPAHRVADMERRFDPHLLGGPWQLAPASHLFAYQLCWPLLRRGRNAPERIGKVDDSPLWDLTYACHACFVVERDFRGGPLRLTVGGASSDDCVRTWHRVAGWMRAFLAKRSTRG